MEKAGNKKECTMQSHFTCEYVNTRTHTKNKMEKKGTKLFTFHLGKEELLMTLGLVFLIGSFVFICYFYIFCFLFEHTFLLK